MALNSECEKSSFVEKTCRACCGFDADNSNNSMTLHPIFNDGETGEPNAEFVNIFKEFSLWNLEIKPNDGLPQQMCTECVERFELVNMFREEVVDAQKLLFSYIKGSSMATAEITELHPTVTIGYELDDFDKLGYVSPSKLVEYVGSEEDFFNTNSRSYVPESDNFEANESDYLFNHPNQIETHTNSNKTIATVQQQQNESNNIPNSEENFIENDPTPLTKIELPNADKLNPENNDTIQCDICMKYIPSLYKLKRHKTQFHLRKDYDCAICNKKLEQITQRNYYYHMKTHRPKKYKCSYCDKAFVQRPHLLNHERIHTNEKPYQCDECGKKYRQEITLHEHKLSHTNPLPWKCDICGKGLKSRSCLLVHRRSHNDGYRCEVCGARYNQKNTLKKHMLKHTEHGDKIFQCKFCFKSFRKSYQLGNHFHTNHLDSSNVKGTYRCAECDLKFQNTSDLIEHHSSHDKTERPFICGPCGKCFGRKIHLESHIDKVHLKKKLFSCIHCYKSFFDISNLNSHMKIHTVEGQERTQYKCDECDKVFITKKSLRTHQFSHSKENRFKCTFCEESFKYRNNLGDHILHHFRDGNEDFIIKEIQNNNDLKSLKDLDIKTEYSELLE